MRRTTTLSLTVAAFALVVGLAACGGSSSDGEKKSTTTEASGSDDPTTTASGDDDTSTTEEESSTTVVATGGGEFCDELAAYMNDASMGDIDMTNPDAYREAIEEQTEKGKELLSKAPGELDDSVETLLDAQDQVISELEKVDFDYTKLPVDALEVMNTPEVTAAGEELNAYVTETCGIDIPQVTAATIPDMTVPEITVPAG